MVFTDIRRCAGTWAVLAMLACAGCGDGSSTGGANPSGAGDGSRASDTSPRLVFITNGSSAWWNAILKGMIDGGRNSRPSVQMRHNEGESSGQIRLLEDVLSMPDVKGVAISVMEKDSPGIADKMRDLLKYGKVVITVNSDRWPDTRRAYIGTINRKAGEVAGHVARMLRPQGGKVVAFVGTAAAANAIERRREGFFDGAGKSFRVSPDRDALEVFEDGTDKSEAKINVQTAIEKYPDASVYLGLWSYTATTSPRRSPSSPDYARRPRS